MRRLMPRNENESRIVLFCVLPAGIVYALIAWHLALTFLPETSPACWYYGRTEDRFWHSLPAHMNISGAIRFRLRNVFHRITRSHDLPSEYQWWNEYLRRRPDICSPLLQKNAFPAQLLSIIERLKNAGASPIRVLEVGSGPVSLLAWGVRQKLIELTAIDPLAVEYRLLLETYGFDYPVKPVRAYAEDLLTIFQENTFDIIYSGNALDHVRSPMKCIENIRRVVRPGGFLYLEGFCREGTNAKWSGLHQHDLLVENGQLLHFNRGGDRTNLTEGLGLKCIYESIVPFVNRSIGSFGHESPVAGEISDWHFRDWYTIVFERAE
jgi:SAM-dependent methyltransferase